MLNFFKRKEFWLNIAGVGLFFLLMFLLFFYLFLPWYTRFGQAVEVPKVTQLTLDEAVAKLEEAGLRYSVDDSLFISTQPPLTIISQDPLPGDSAKPDRIVHLTVNKAIPPMVKFPRILGVSQYQARLRLEGQGLQIGSVKMVPNDYADLVLRAFVKGRALEEGDSIPKGTRIDLEVGEGRSDDKVPVPDLKGKDIAEAIAILSRLGIFNTQTKYDPARTETPGTVVIQNPPFAELDSIRISTEITLIIAGPEPVEGADEVLPDGE